MRRLKAVSLLLTAALILGGCAKKDPGAITVDISKLERDCMSVDGVRAAFAQWQESYPGHGLIERESVGSNDLVSLAVMGAEHLPDVFVTDGRTGRLLAEAGLVVNLTGLAADVDTFTYGGEVYAYPMAVESNSVIVYDPLAYDGSSPVGFNAQDPYAFVNCYVSSLIGDDEGQEWLNHMVAADRQASFTDDYFIDRMDSALEMLNEDIPYGSVTELIDAFISGECPAVFVSGSDVRILLQTVRADDPGLYDRIEFTSLTDDGLPSGTPYGVFIRAGLDDEELVACVRLADEMSSSSAMEDADDTIARLNALVAGSDHTGILSLYFIYNFWYLAYEANYDRFTEGNITAGEFAGILQNYYEMYYI